MDEPAAPELLPDPPEASSDDLQTLIRSQMDSAVSFVDGTLSPERARLARYFEGELPDLDSEEGRSAAVATVVRDAIVAMKPALLRTFFGPERVVEFVPRLKPGQSMEAATAAAELQTAYINYIVTEDNPGFLVFSAAMEDALVKDFGILKWYWDERVDTEGLIYEHLTLPELELLAQGGPGVQVEVESLEPNAFGGLKVALTRVRTEGRARIEAVPPEEFLFTRSARSLETASFLAHRNKVPLSDLVAMGYPLAELKPHLSGSDDLLTNDEALQRVEWDGVFATDDAELGGDDASLPLRKVKYVECYLRYDQDGDGIAELRRVCCVGDDYHILRNEAAADIPFAVMMADPKPHTLQGRGIARRVDANQKIQSAILRATLDSLSGAVAPRMGYVEGQVNVKDLLNPEVNGLIRMRQPGMLQEVRIPFVGADTMPMLEYFQGKVEDATGTSRAAAGLNPDALQSSTKAAVAATVTAAQQQTELVARFLAETGFKPVFRGLYQLVKRHQSESRMVKLFGTFVEVNPASWDDADADVTVNVALGLGLTEDRIAALTAIGADQKEVLATLGPQNPIVTLKQYRDTLARKVVLAGWKNAEAFYQQVDPNWQPPPQEPPTDPAAEQLAQIEMLKVQTEAQDRAAKLAQDAQLAREQMALEARKMDLEDARERDKLIVEMQLEAAKISSDAATKLDVARLRRVAVTPEAG